MGLFFKYLSSLFLAGLLLLLTIGLPLAYSPVQSLSKNADQSSAASNKNPYSNSTEEKTPSAGSISITEEYVHETRCDLHLPAHQISIAYIHAHEATYVAYHGELHYPPPNLI